MTCISLIATVSQLYQTKNEIRLIEKMCYEGNEKAKERLIYTERANFSL